MVKAETPAEEFFLATLDEYCALVNDQEHIGLDEDGIRRLFVTFELHELSEILSKTISITQKLLQIIDSTKNGEVRQRWVKDLLESCRIVARFGQTVSEIVVLRYH